MNPSRFPGWRPWLFVVLLACLLPLAGESTAFLRSWPTDWLIPLADWINQFVERLVVIIKPLTRLVSTLLESPMIWLRDLLQWLPWPVTIALTVLLAIRLGGHSLAVLCAVALLYIALSGYWRQAMNTLALVGIAVPLSLLIGLLLGIAGQRTVWGRRLIPPLLDLMQTIPTFAYLVPLLVLFGFGPVVGLIASAIYACPPMVRNVQLGLSRVSSEIVEAGRIAGSSRFQQLFWVELPAAMSQIKVGINQTIMAALSMVIIASVIGGFDDIGWEVLSTMRKARFGESLMAGLVIVLLAVIMDRLSAAWAERDSANNSRHRLLGRGTIVLLLVLVVLPALYFLFSQQSLSIESPAWSRALTTWLDNSLNEMVVSSATLLTNLKNTIFFYYLLPLRIGLSQAILPMTWGIELTDSLRYLMGGLAAISISVALILRRPGLAIGLFFIAWLLWYGFTGMPWSIVALALALLAFQLQGWQLAMFCSTALAFILFTGMWERAMLSAYLCTAAVIGAFVFGALLGVLAASSDRVSAIVRPVCDTFQTIPLFVFLIPVLMFFQVGEFTALLAIIAYAFVPAVRYTENGLRQLPAELEEIARAQGCTRWQSFIQIRLPLAMPAILVGLNQTIMYAFAMLVIAALVGTTGLGQQIFLALSAADTGLGLIAGISMALLAIIMDQILRRVRLVGDHS